MVNHLVSLVGVPLTDAEHYVRLVEKASFSNEALGADELSDATQLYRTILRALRASVSRSKRLRIVLSA